MKLKAINIVNTTNENGEAIKIVEVLWKQELFDAEGNLVQEANHRCSYSIEQKEQFLAEVEGAENYITILGW